jgi:hypothetical protein
MILKEWEPIIQQFVDQSNNELQDAGKRRVLVEWRAKLSREPFRLSPHHIDEIVREVRRRCEATGG